MYKIIIDSCGELTEDLKKDNHFCNVALTLDVDGHIIEDDESFDQKDFLKRVKESPNQPKSACPSPEKYLQAFDGEADHIYVVTLSAAMSGSYNSACLAKDLYEEANPGKKHIHVFDSKSASLGETIIGLMVKEAEELQNDFHTVVSKVEEYIKNMNTYFVLETLETLRKAGRLSNLKAILANTLNIKPIMSATDEGMIQQLGQARGIKKALCKMVEEVLTSAKNCEEKIIAISHCNCPERAEFVRKELEKAAKFKKVLVSNMAGVSSMYANEGGIIVVL